MSENKPSKVIDTNFRKIAQLYSIFEIDYDVELFSKQLSVDDFDIDYMIPLGHTFDQTFIGNTILYRIGYDNNLFSQTLIDRGADFTVINKNGSTVLHKEISSHYKAYLHRLKYIDCEEKSNTNVVLSAHIKTGNTKNPKDRNGLSHFHIACMFNNANGVEFFLKNNVSINETVNKDSNFYPGYSAIHFAIKSCAVETAKLLLKSGADIFVEDSEGMNSLNLLIVERINIFITLKRISRRTPLNKIEHYSHLQKYYHRNNNILDLFIDRINQCGNNFLANAKFFLIHLIFYAENTRIKQFIDCNKEIFVQLVNTGSQALLGRTPVHIAAYFSAETLELLIKNGASLTTKDANNMTPLDICLTGFNVVDVHKIISQHPDYSRLVFSNGKTKLSDFIYAMQDITTFDIFLSNNLTDVNMYIPFDSPACAGCTPLHLAVICTEQPLNWSWENDAPVAALFVNFLSEESQKYLSRINLCLRYNPDVTSRDARGATPLHWAFRLQESYVVHRLLHQHETSSNYVDEYGLSHLHIACAAKDEALVEKFLIAGAHINQVATSGYTWLDLNSTEKFTLHSGKCLINKGSTPLHFAVSVQSPRVVEILLNHEADVLAKDADGFNPLERLVGRSIFVNERCTDKKPIYVYENEKLQIAELLIRKITNILVDTEPHQLMYCYSLLYNKILSNICQYNDESFRKIIENWNITALHIACFTKDLERICDLVAEIDVNARVNLSSPLWPGWTPLHLHICCVTEEQVNTLTTKTITEILLERGANVAAMNSDGETPLHRAFEFRRVFPQLDVLLDYMQDLSVNPTSEVGFSHLHIASFAGRTSIVEKLLDDGAEIDQPADFFNTDDLGDACAGYTALHFAIAHQRIEVVQLLLKRGANVNWRNAYDENALHVASKHNESPIELFQILYSAGADIHAINKYGNTPFESLIKSEDFTDEQFNFLRQNTLHRFNNVNPVTEEGFLAIVLNKDQHLPIFETVIKYSNINEIDDHGRNAIHNIVSFRRPSWHHFTEDAIDEKYTPPDDYIKAIGSLIKLGLDIDHQDCNGLTPLHVAAQMENLTGIVGLLENGADINIIDAYGEPAFAYSLELTELYEKLSELHSRILEVISFHIFKLNLARIEVSNRNENLVVQIREIYQFEMPKVLECFDEIEKMVNLNINSESVTYHQFLSDTGAVGAFPYMLPSKREAIDYVFRNKVESLREIFPEFTGILLLQYKKAFARRDKLNSALTSLDSLVGFHMPAVCSKIILRFLSNDDLDNLILCDDLD